MNRSEKKTSRNILPALAILGIGALGLIYRGNILIYLAVSFGVIAFGISWATRLIIYLLRRYKGTIPLEPDDRRLTRWLAEPVALLVVALFTFTPALFLIGFSRSYHFLSLYVSAAQAKAQSAFPGYLGSAQDFHGEFTNDGRWYIYHSPDREVGSFKPRETLVSKCGDVLIVTHSGAEFDNDEGVYFTKEKRFIDYYGTVGTIGSFQIGRKDKFVHIFGPWYYWECQ